MNSAAVLERGRVVAGGMGGFLNPPTHPEHDWHVETDLRRRSENRGGMSLTAAAAATWITSETRAAARYRLKAWIAPPVDSPEVREWIERILGYFKGCYRGPGDEPECWNAENLVIVKPDDAARPNDEHAGVHLIREYYPHYAPTSDDFARARWGR